ncbi:MAG: hypothetical protein HC890_12450 [Chloroflexaceae bacterium]|nr:hypothetical protein [Chloroflexaceae bacterium]
MESTTVLKIFYFAAVGLLLMVSLGILYLSAAEWRDRRRRDRDKRSS